MRLDAFLGEWWIERAITDAGRAGAGRFEGRARFARDDSELAYVEDGELTLNGGGRFRASRRYRWRDGADGSIEVRFEDGRLFHSFRADDPRPAAAHDCAPDEYRVRYDFRFWPVWRADWRVLGPRKDLRIRSVFTRRQDDERR